MTAFDASVDINGAFLSSTIVAVHCAHCNQSTPIAGFVHEVYMLWRHRDHLGDVSVDLFLCDRDTNRISAMRLCLIPRETQFFRMN